MRFNLFDFNGYLVRQVGTWDSPLFVAADVCAVLELSDVSMSCSRLDADEKLVQTLLVSGRNRDLLCVTESGLYSLVLRSRKPQAHAFRKWITNELVPSIRKTGSYTVKPTPTPLEALDRFHQRSESTQPRPYRRRRTTAPAPHTPDESSFAAASETLAFMQSLGDVVQRYGGNPQASAIHALTMTAAKHPEVAPVIDQAIDHMLCCRHVDPAPLLTPTDIAHIMGAPMSPQKVNHMLLNLRLQVYSSYDADENWSTYELTDIGRNYGRVVYPMVKGAKRCVPQIKWLQTTLELLAF